MVLRDFEEYCNIQAQVSKDYNNKELWWHKAIMNTAMSGFFSSDRTIADYNDNIWHLKNI